MSAEQDNTDGGAPTSSAALFTPEQQAWLETFVSTRRVVSPSGTATTSTPTSNPAPTTSAGNLGELLTNSCEKGYNTLGSLVQTQVGSSIKKGGEVRERIPSRGTTGI